MHAGAARAHARHCGRELGLGCGGGVRSKLFDEALAVATRIAAFSLAVVLKIKEAINRAYESSLAEGLLFERREFHSTLALEDQKEGMRAFVGKRKPNFKHR